MNVPQLDTTTAAQVFTRENIARATARAGADRAGSVAELVRLGEGRISQEQAASIVDSLIRLTPSDVEKMVALGRTGTNARPNKKGRLALDGEADGLRAGFEWDGWLVGSVIGIAGLATGGLGFGIMAGAIALGGWEYTF